MIFTLFITLVCSVYSGHIFTLDATTSYDMEGSLETLRIPFKLETALLPGSMLHFVGPKLHSLTVIISASIKSPLLSSRKWLRL
jgi:hypothetical protein